MRPVINLFVTMVATLTLIGSAHAEGGLKAADLSPKYAAGMVQNWVRDFNQPFDQWGRKYIVR